MLGDWHSQTITVEPWVSDSPTGWRGQQDYGDVQTYSARIEYTQARVTNPEGHEMLSRGRALILGTISGIDTRARLTLPATFTPRQPPILNIEVNPDPTGLVEHTVIWF